MQCQRPSSIARGMHSCGCASGVADWLPVVSIPNVAVIAIVRELAAFRVGYRANDLTPDRLAITHALITAPLRIQRRKNGLQRTRQHGP